MSNKLNVKIVIEVEYKLNDEKAYNLITAIQQSINLHAASIVNCTSVMNADHTPAELISWDSSITQEEL